VVLPALAAILKGSEEGGYRLKAWAPCPSTCSSPKCWACWKANRTRCTNDLALGLFTDCDTARRHNTKAQSSSETKKQLIQERCAIANNRPIQRWTVLNWKTVLEVVA